MAICNCDQCRFANGEISWADSLGVELSIAVRRCDAMINLTAAEQKGLSLDLRVKLWAYVQTMTHRSFAVMKFKDENQEEISSHDETRRKMRVVYKKGSTSTYWSGEEK